MPSSKSILRFAPNMPGPHYSKLLKTINHGLFR